MDHDDDRPLNREDFDDYESWLRHCREGGIDLAHENEEFAGIVGDGFHASVLGGVLGHSRREYERAWASRGWTRFIPVPQFEKAYRAVAFLNCLGGMMNTTLDIAWSTAGVGSTDGVESDVVVMERQQNYLDALRRWCERHDYEAAWIWVLERGHVHGLHTHLYASVPDHLFPHFKQYARDTLDSQLKGKTIWTPKSKTLVIKHRYGRQVYPQWRRFLYMLKGLTSEYGWRSFDGKTILKYEDRVRVDTRPAGVVTVKRLGVSRFLDKASVERWTAINSFPSMRITPAVGEELYDDRFLQWFDDNRDRMRDPRDAKMEGEL